MLYLTQHLLIPLPNRHSLKMHDDLRKSEKDSTLEHSLFAAFNTE